MSGTYTQARAARRPQIIERQSPRGFMDDERPRWATPVMARLTELCALPNGWDGYKAPPVSFLTAEFSLQMLRHACGPNAPIPDIVPGTGGDLQVEWHTEDWDIELHVRQRSDVIAFRRSVVTGDTIELPLTIDFTEVARWISELSEAKHAVVSPTAH